MARYDSWIAECDALSPRFDGEPMLDPFGLDRGVFRYAEIGARLRAIMVVLRDGVHLSNRVPG